MDWREGEVGNVKDLRRNSEDRLEMWKWMRSGNMVRFSITVSFNHSKWQEVMKGRLRGDEEMKGFGEKGSESQHDVRVCEMQWTFGMSLRAFAQFKVTFKPNLVGSSYAGKTQKSTWDICVHVCMCDTYSAGCVSLISDSCNYVLIFNTCNNWQNIRTRSKIAFLFFTVILIRLMSLHYS